MARAPSSKSVRRTRTRRVSSERKSDQYPQDGPINSIVLALGVLLKRSANADFRRTLSLSSTEWPIIGILWTNGALGVTEICARLGRDKSHVSRDLSGLMDRGLLYRHGDAADGRRTLVDFTARGHSVVRKFAAISQKRAEELTRSLTAEEQQKLRRMLMVLVRNVREMHPHD